MNERKAKGTKYLVLLIITLLLMFFGSSVLLYIVAIPFKNITGLNINQLADNIRIYENYFSNEPYDDYMTWAQFAEEYFSNDPVLFSNLGTFYCTVQFMSYVPILIVAIYFLREELAEDIVAFKGDLKNNLKVLGIGFVAMYVSAYIVGYIYSLFDITGESSNQDLINLLLDSPGKILMVIAVVILAPIAEELIFRKLLIGTCEEKFRFKPIVAIIISSVIFSFIHVTDLESLKYIFQYIALATPICATYHYSKNNVVVTIILHMINNFISILSVFLL